MKATLILMALLVAGVRAGDINEFAGTAYNSGNAAFSGGRDMLITQHGLIVKNGDLYITPRGLYSSCGNMYYGNGKLTVVDGFYSYSNDGTSRVRSGNYFAGNNGQTYIYDSDGSE